MSIWFEGKNDLECTAEKVKSSVEDLSKYFVGVVRLMPGLTKVDLVEKGDDFVTIETNEGVMKRTNVVKQVGANSVSIEFDEEYQAGSKTTVKSHYIHKFDTGGENIQHRVVISDVEASGVLGFFYRAFAKASIGKAILSATKSYFEM